MSEQPAVIVKNLHKSFRLPHEQHSGIKQLLVNFTKNNRGYEVQHVLDDISFEIKKGEFFGIVGKNGSGKSTLLKLLAGIYTPDSGDVYVNGTLTPFIELGVGFNPELTGRENVFMNGALLGFGKKEVEAMYDDIVSFAELERFMDQKLKNYSSGMQVRLAFSIAIRAESNILLFDEVLAVGDAAFQQKCYEMFANMKDSGRTVILVTHDMSAVQRFCSSAIMLEKGKVILQGDPNDIANHYLEENSSSDSSKEVKASEATPKISVELSNSKSITKRFTSNDEVRVKFTTPGIDKNRAVHVGFQIFSSDGAYVFGTNSQLAGLEPLTSASEIIISFHNRLGPGVYFVNVAIMSKSTTTVYNYYPKVASFNVTSERLVHGIVSLDDKWEVGNV